MAGHKPYRDIFKATTLMGGVQIIQIIVRIIRMKVVSVILGAGGMGINALFQNSINLLGSITSLGLNMSAVRDISQAKKEGDGRQLSMVVKSLRSWIWVTGLIGSVVMLALSPLLSKWTFGSGDYTWGFVWLSCVMLFKALADGENSIMRGMQHLRSMAKASTIGAAIGLAVSVPLYYIWEIKGIVPALILSAVITFICERRYSRKIKFEKIDMTVKEQFDTGKNMAKLGVMLVLSSFIGYFSVYFTNILIRLLGGISEVGLYQAGVNLSNQYVGMIFAAMSTDYFPRLSAVWKDNRRLKVLVNQQAEIAMLIIAPIAVGIILSAPVVIRILYTKEFIPIIGYLQWISVGVLFKACSWAMAFTILAKGNSKLFLYTELISNVIIMGLTVLGYYLGGITGTGIAYCISYMIYTVIIYTVIHRNYNFRFIRRYMRIFLILLGMVVLSLVTTILLGYPRAYVSNAVILAGALVFSYRELDKRISFKDMFREK